VLNKNIIYNGYLFFLPQNTTTKENESLMAIGTVYVQGEDVAARGRMLLFSFTKSENSQNLVDGKSSIVLIWRKHIYSKLQQCLTCWD
jgi:hypothetical protein